MMATVPAINGVTRDKNAEIKQLEELTKRHQQPTNAKLPPSLKTKAITGGALTYQPLVFSSDSRWFYLMKLRSVGVYQAETGMIIRHLELPRKPHSKKYKKQQITQNGAIPAAASTPVWKADSKLVATIPHPSSKQQQVYGVCDDGNIVLWDPTSGDVIRSWATQLPIQRIAIDSKIPHSFYVASRQMASGQPTKSHLIFSVTVDPNSHGVKVERILKMSNTCIGLSLSTDGQWLASFSRFKLYLTHFQPGEKRVQHKWEFNERLSTVAFHPTEPYLALGDWRGRIILWYGMDPLDADTTNRAISKRSLHWHSRRVHSVAFSPDGKHMLSGGEEGVLVIWQLDTDKRTFISRLGADLMGVTFSPDQLYYGITLNDNTVKVYSAVNRSLVSVAQGLQLAGHLLQAKTATSSALKSKYKAAENKLSRALQGDLCDPTYTGPTTNKKLSDEQHDEAMQLLLLPNRLTTGLAVHPITNHVTLNGEAGLLQVYNPVSDRHVFTIEVAPFNHTSGSTPEGGIKLPHVESVKYSSDGQWMVTVDSRYARSLDSVGEDGHSNELYLKFWLWSPKQQSYVLNTRVDKPHPSRVFDIAFQPQASASQGGLMCATTGDDDRFRVWELQCPRQGETRGMLRWTCRSVGYYRGLHPAGVAFSRDGSILAVTFGPHIAIWDPVLNQMRRVLTGSIQAPPLKGVAFISSTQYIVAWSNSHVDVWNLLTSSIEWSLPILVTQLHTDPRWNLFTVVSNIKQRYPRGSVTMVFSPTSPSPRAVYVLSEPALSVACVPSQSQHGETDADDSAGDESVISSNGGPLDGCLWLLLTSSGQFHVLGSDGAGLSVASDLTETNRDVKLKPDQFSQIFGSASRESTFVESAGVPGTGADDSTASAEAELALRYIRPTLRSAYQDAPSHIMPSVDSLFEQLIGDTLSKLAAELRESQTVADAKSSGDRDQQALVNGDAMDIETPPTDTEAQPPVKDDEASAESLAIFKTFFAGVPDSS